MNARDEMLEILRRHRTAPYADVHPVRPTEPHSDNSRPDDRVPAADPAVRDGAQVTHPTETFLQRCRENGALAHLATSPQDALDILSSCVRERRPGRIIVSRHDALVRMGIVEHLRAGFGEDVTEDIRDATDADARALATCRIGVGHADAGFADSGAVALLSSPSERRSLSLLPEAHIALLSERHILPGLDAYARRMASCLQEQSSAVTLIAGPSKTADIEKVLVTGVHGPREFIVIIIAHASE